MFRWAGKFVTFVTSVLIIIFTVIVVICIVIAQGFAPLIVPVRFFFAKTNKYASGITALATIGIVVLTGVYVFYTERLWQTTAEALTSVQRAFVTPRGLTFLWHYDEKVSKVFWEMAPVWKNSGTTPTRDMRINVNSYFETTPLPSDFEFPLASGESVPVFVGPQDTASGDAIIKQGDELLAVHRQEEYFYIWGCARYRDIFKGTPDHLTRFAWRISIQGDPTRPSDSSNVVRYTTRLLPRHNCLDKECEREDRESARSANKGDGMVAGDDEARCIGEIAVWRPPARSGYEIYMEKMGKTPDPYMKQFGRGGTTAGYAEKFRLIDHLRSDYFRSHSKTPESILANVNAVPLDYLNTTLQAMHETWRVRIVSDQYEFFIPNPP